MLNDVLNQISVNIDARIKFCQNMCVGPTTASQLMPARIRVATYNIMRDSRHESIGTFKWSNRESRIKALLYDMNADILCLQECRDLPDHAMAPFLHLNMAPQYRFSIHASDKQLKQLKVVTLWKANAFTLVHSHTFWLNRAIVHCMAPKLSRPIGLDILLHNSTGAILWVFNTHFGCHESGKDASIATIGALMRGLFVTAAAATTTTDVSMARVILAGDFNLFGATREAQRILLKNQYGNRFCLHDQGQHAITALHARHENGTFVGTSIDEYSPPLLQIGERLDHIFSSNLESHGAACIWNKTMLTEEPAYLEDRDMFPSDHLPLSVTFELA